MTFTGNTIPYKTEWIKAYQETHYRQPVFPVFADQKFADELTQGASIKWSYDSDADVQQMGTDGSYSVGNKTVTDETLTVDQRPYSSFRIPATERIQDHRPTQQKWAQKAMNRVFWWLDSKILGALQAGAASSLSAGDFGGTTGNPISLNTSVAPAIFTASRRVLRNQNVIYDMNKRYQNVVKLDTVSKFAACAIPPELEEQYLLSVGFKPGDLGDQVIRDGFLDKIFGFNTFVSTALPFTALFTQTGTPTNGDTIVIGGTTLTFVTGTPTNPGDVKAETDANTSMTNLKNFLNAPYASISGKSVALTRSSLTQADAFLFDMISMSTPSAGAATLTILGHGTVPVSATGSGMVISKKAVHALFGTSQSIALILQRYPNLDVSAGTIIGNGSTGGYVAQDFVTWSLAGWKMFKTHTFQMVDVPIDASNFSQPQAVLY